MSCHVKQTWFLTTLRVQAQQTTNFFATAIKLVFWERCYYKPILINCVTFIDSLYACLLILSSLGAIKGFIFLFTIYLFLLLYHINRVIALDPLLSTVSTMLRPVGFHQCPRSTISLRNNMQFYVRFLITEFSLRFPTSKLMVLKPKFSKKKHITKIFNDYKQGHQCSFCHLSTRDIGGE